MTCIAGIAQDGKVWIGGDSAGVAGYTLVVRADEKVFVRGEFAYGFTTSFRMGDLLRYAFSPPEQTSKQEDREYLVTSWTDALRQCLKAGGFAKVENGVERGGSFLAGYRGRLYEVCGDFQVGEAASGYAAVGCGVEIALGALFATGDDREWLPPEGRILTALAAAETHSAGVRGPFTVVSV